MPIKSTVSFWSTAERKDPPEKMMKALKHHLKKKSMILHSKNVMCTSGCFCYDARTQEVTLYLDANRLLNKNFNHKNKKNKIK